MPRFVWYANRFAGLHFELVNFSFTAFTAGVNFFSHVKNRLIFYFGIAALSTMIYIVSKSNYTPIFIATLIFSLMLLKSPLRLRKLIYLSYFSILICVLLTLSRSYLVSRRNSIFVSKKLCDFGRKKCYLYSALSAYFCNSILL